MHAPVQSTRWKDDARVDKGKGCLVLTLVCASRERPTGFDKLYHKKNSDYFCLRTRDAVRQAYDVSHSVEAQACNV